MTCFRLVRQAEHVLVMSRDWLKLRVLGRKNKEGVPTNAIALQLLIVNVLLLTRSFEGVVQYIQFTLLLCSLLTVLGTIVLRVRQANLARPYRVWAYPLPPLVFSIITLWMMLYLLRMHALQSLFGLGTAALGVLLYFGAVKPFRALK